MLSAPIHKDLAFIIENIYDKCGYKYTSPIKEAESSEYGAYTFELNGQSIKFRSAKITPTKIGQFVTLWKRDKNGITQPHDILDPINLFIISTKKDNHFGHFVFPKSVLIKQGVISNNGKGGKRGIRVYSPWDIPTNKQAKKTQAWQLNYFLEINESKSVDFERIKMLYKIL